MNDDPTPICFAHAAYQLGDEYQTRPNPLPFVEVRDRDALLGAIGEAATLVVSGLWRNDLIEKAGRLRLIQSVSAGTDQYDRDLLRAKGIRLASAQGVNEIAVSEQALGMLLALTRHLHLARDHQNQAEWLPFIPDPRRRQEELDGKTALVVGLGRIGARIARLLGAFGMRVIGLRRGPAAGHEPVERMVRGGALLDVLPEVDVVVLSCALTPETRGLMGEAAFAALKPGAHLVSVARGQVVDTDALVAALADGRLAGAALDCFEEEPLPPSSPLWRVPNLIVTPHSAGETRRYEARIVDCLVENLSRLRQGQALLNQIV